MCGIKNPLKARSERQSCLDEKTETCLIQIKPITGFYSQVPCDVSEI